MKIALVYDAAYPYIKGGGEKRFYDIAHKLKKKYEVHLYCMKFWSGKNIIKKDNIFYHGLCKVVPFYTKNKKRSIFEAIYFGLSCFKLLKEDFDVMDCSGFPYFSIFPARIACLIRGKKLVSTFHETWGKEYWNIYLGKKGIFGYIVEKLATKLPNQIIAVSDHTKRGLISKLKVNPNKITVIENGLDIAMLSKIKLSKQNSDIIFVGRLIPSKNVDLLIKAISEIKKVHSKIKAIIIGDGPEKERLENLTRKLKLDGNVIFTGFLPETKEVYSLIKSSKVFVLPSEREGFGIAVVESNALGIPVVTVNCKENNAQFLIQSGKNGFISDPNEKSLADGIIKSLASGGKMKRNCIDSIKKYNWTRITPMLEEAYK